MTPGDPNRVSKGELTVVDLPGLLAAPTRPESSVKFPRTEAERLRRCGGGGVDRLLLRLFSRPILPQFYFIIYDQIQIGPEPSQVLL